MRAGFLFDGIGGFPLGFRRAGVRNVWSIEIDGACDAVLRRHFPEAAHFRDVARIGPWIKESFGEVDVIAGGFPCQDISVAGHRAGLDGARSKLWWEFHRILGEQRPQWCLIENVAGLLTSGKRRDLGAILGSLGDLGYGWAYRVLDAQGFGVPQRRRRVFIVGCVGNAAGAAQVLLEPESGGGDLAPRTEPGQVIAGTPESRTTGGGFPGTDGAIANHVVPAFSPTLMAKHQRNHPDEEAFIITPQPFRKSTRVHGADTNDETWVDGEVANTLDATGNSTRTSHAVLTPVPPLAFHLTQDPISGSVSPALSMGASHGAATIGVQNELGVRRLTPRECERLQGFPDDWTDGQSDNKRYKQLGNAVAVPVAEWIARRMKTVHDEEYGNG